MLLPHRPRERLVQGNHRRTNVDGCLALKQGILWTQKLPFWFHFKNFEGKGLEFSVNVATSPSRYSMLRTSIVLDFNKWSRSMEDPDDPHTRTWRLHRTTLERWVGPLVFDGAGWTVVGGGGCLGEWLDWMSLDSSRRIVGNRFVWMYGWVSNEGMKRDPSIGFDPSQPTKTGTPTTDERRLSHSTKRTALS